MSIVTLLLFFLQTPTTIITSPATDLSIPLPQDTVFIASSYDEGSSNYTYHWTFSTGETFEGSIFTYSNQDVGPLSVSVVAKDSTGQESAPDTRMIYVVDPHDLVKAPTVTGINLSRRIIHAGDTVIATGDILTPSNPPVTYLWFWHDGTTAYRYEGQEVAATFPNPYPSNQSFPLSLIVRDSQNRYSLWTKRVDIYIGDGNLPPEGKIIEPESSSIRVTPDSPVLFQATGDDYEDNLPLEFIWRTGDGGQYTGSTFNTSFTSTGRYTVSLFTRDSLGNEDPDPPIVNIQVVEMEPPDPSASISFPVFHRRLYKGESMFFRGFAYDDANSQVLEGTFTINDVTGQQEPTSIQGNQTGRVPFREQGLYYVTYDAAVEEVNSPRSRQNARWVSVQDRTRSREPDFAFLEDDIPLVKNGTTVQLDLEIPKPGYRFFWMIDGMNIGEQGKRLSHTINIPEAFFDRGIYMLQIDVVAVDPDNRPLSEPATKYIRVYKNVRVPSLSLEGFDLTQTIFIPKGTTFEPHAIVDNPSNLEMNYTWRVLAMDFMEPELNFHELSTGPITFSRAALYMISMNGVTDDESLQTANYIMVYIHVYDPELLPACTITQPHTASLNIDSGASYRFEGFVSEPNFIKVKNEAILNQAIENQVNWVHMDPNGRRSEFPGESLELVFDLPGTHTIYMETTNTLGLEDPSPDSRSILVESAELPDRFEPNDSQEQAVLIKPGQLSNLTLDEQDRVDWYKLDIAEAGVMIQFKFDLTDSTQNINGKLYLEELLLQTQTLEANRVNHFTVRAARAGTYYLHFELEGKKKSDGLLTFGVGVNTLTPQLSYPYIFNSEMNPFRIHIVNPENQAGEILLQARDRYGVLLGENHYQVPPFGKANLAVSEVFPGLDNQNIAWIQVHSDLTVMGVGTRIAIDNETGIAEPAFLGSYQELIIPHIAQLTQQWYTLASITNATSFSINPTFQTSLNSYELTSPNASYEGNDFDFLDFFQGSIPEDGTWGRFLDESSEQSMTGWEIFGKVDGNLQSAAISMIPPHLKNPNFTYIRRDLYFPHIAKDTASFWTGIAFVNTANVQATGKLKAYDESGQLLAEEQIELPANAKQVALVHNFFPTLGEEVPIAWVMLETGDPFQGFELFGSGDGSNRRLAGFPAVRGAGKVLHFLNIYPDLQNYWTGLAVVNISNNPTTLLYEGFDADGGIVVSAQRPVGPFQKDVALIENIFSTVPNNLAWVKVTSPQPIAAFQLFGDHSSKFMAGCLAQ